MDALDNLVKINQLKAEPPDQAEFDGMLAAARCKLQDAQLEDLSKDSQFTLTYGAACTGTIGTSMARLSVRQALHRIPMPATYGQLTCGKNGGFRFVPRAAIWPSMRDIWKLKMAC